LPLGAPIPQDRPSTGPQHLAAHPSSNILYCSNAKYPSIDIYEYTIDNIDDIGDAQAVGMLSTGSVKSLPVDTTVAAISFKHGGLLLGNDDSCLYSIGSVTQSWTVEEIKAAPRRKADGAKPAEAPNKMDSAGETREKTLVAISREVSSSAGYLYAYSVGDSGALTPLQDIALSCTDPVALALSPDGRWLAVASNSDDTIILFSVANDGTLQERSRAEMTSAACLAFMEA
jgi:6-phosphogluconolactonase (cycloisomerase 2 family)